MSLSDPIADYLTGIRNAVMRKNETARTPLSKIKLDISAVLKREGFIADYRTISNERAGKTLEVNLKYTKNGASVLRGIKRVSRCGLRIHRSYRDIGQVLNGQGLSIITTSKGLKTDSECRTEKIGGEVLCEVW